MGYYENYDIPESDDVSEKYAIVDEFIEQLKSCADKETKEEMEYLKEENDRIKKENCDLRIKVENIEKLESELKQKIENAKQDFYTEKLNGLLNYLQKFEELYKIKYNTVELPKCDCCDENRCITFFDRIGRQYYVRCKCDRRIRQYYFTNGFYKAIIKRGENLVLSIGRCLSGESLIYLEDKKHIIEKFDENNPPKSYDGVFFTDENEAKKYVDWLNKKEIDGGIDRGYEDY